MGKCGTGIAALVLCPVIFLAVIGCQKAEQPLEEVTVQLTWHHQAQFAGFYAADQNGFYAEEGLDVSLLPASAPGTDVVGIVAGGTADFGVANAVNVVTARGRGSAITAVVCIYRRYPLVFMTLADSGIAGPRDFPGRAMSAVTKTKALAFEAMMRRSRTESGSVRQVETGWDLTPFFAREVDIWPGFVTNEVLTAENAGIEVNLIFPDDYSVHLYGDTLFTSDRLIRENPDLVLRFVRATLRGWRWAVENAKEAGRLSLEYDPTLDAEHQVAQMEASLPLIHTGEDQIGWMRAEVWQTTHDILREQGFLAGPVDIDRIYTMEFLHEIYGGPEQ